MNIPEWLMWVLVTIGGSALAAALGALVWWIAHAIY